MRSRRSVPFAAALAAIIVILSACSPTTTPSPSATAPTATPVASATPEITPPPVAVDFTLLNFNIEYGGVQVDFAKIVEAAVASGADVIALEEAEGNTQQLADEAGYPFANVRNQIISKFPIIDPPGADGRYVLIEVSPGLVVAVSNVHLPSDPYGPYDVRDGKTPAEVIALEEETRLPAIEERLVVLPELVAAGIPTFLTGDFNAPSHLDWTAAAVGSRPHILYPLDWPVSKAVEAAGFRDAYREIHPDPVTHPGLTWWAGRPLVDDYPDHSDPQDRIDLVYVSGAATTTGVKILGEVGGPQVDIATDPWGTDHRAVLAAFSVVPGVAAPYIAVDERLVTVGDPLTVRFHGPGTWVALAIAIGSPSGGDVAQVEPVTERDGALEVSTRGLAAGDYEVRLMAGAEVLSRSPFWIATPDALVTLSAAKPTFAAGEPITVSWRDAPGSRWDWIGIYPRGGDPFVDDYLFYVYTGQSIAGSVVIDENGEGEWPLAPGDYDAHYLLDDGYTSLAAAPFTVSP